MARIVPKLNLNKTPALVESNSLIFAKNIRLDVDNTIHEDYGVFPMSIHEGNKVQGLVDYQNILNRIISDIQYDCDNTNVKDYYFDVLKHLEILSGKITSDVAGGEYKNNVYKIVGIIPSSNEFYIFINGSYKYVNQSVEINNTINEIIVYDEKDDKFSPCNCNWHWSGGSITGCVINNLIGEKILNVAEYGTVDLVPLKAINLNTSNKSDNETVYTQVPVIPLTNLSYYNSFSYVIPNGVYQFFIRYRIRKNFYTNWFPASNEIFVGNKNNVITSFGTLSYTNTHRDSDNSFVLSVEHLIKQNENNYIDYQIGFILSHDDAIYARAWKHFTFDTTLINFDYRPEDAEEIEVLDVIKDTYGLYNVGNIVSFKNKLYISNYTETNYNDKNLQSYADAVDIKIRFKGNENTYAGYPIIESTINSKLAIAGLKIENTDKYFYGNDGIIYELLNTKETPSTPSIYQSVQNALSNEVNDSKLVSSAVDSYGIRIISKVETLTQAKKELINTYHDYKDNNKKVTYKVSFPDNDIVYVTVNNKDIDNTATILPSLYTTQRYLNEDCAWINQNGELDNTVKIVIARRATVVQKIELYNGGGFQPQDPIYKDDTNSFIKKLNKDLEKFNSNESEITTDTLYFQTIEIDYIAWKYKYSTTNSNTLINNTTLIPYQKYKFYIHFVKDNGETTNGYYCSNAGEIEAPYMENCTSVLYPVFDNITIPSGYSACFFSISHTKINTSTIFNINDVDNQYKKEGSCIDINMMLLPGNKNIHIKQEHLSLPDANNNISIVKSETFSGQYYNSADASIPKYFGADGVVTFDKSTFVNGKLAYIINDYGISENENIELIKCTPYLNNTNLETSDTNTKYFSEYSKMNLLGYICSITPLLRDRCIKYYTDGSSVYYKGYDTDNIYLTELNKYNKENITDDKKLSKFNLISSPNVYIYSNFNLNYVTLSQEPTLSIKTYYDRAAADTGVTEKLENQSSTILLRLIPSQVMSDIYELPSMYKSYTRKTFSIYNEENFVRFDNTIRSSVLYGDENNINVLTFDANDYYNVPTNRGIIVNLVSVGDSIIVHTQDSMFKFSGSNKLQSSNGEIQTNESNIFDTGISEVFGSDFGFAGLQNKNDHIVTENGYIFFDRDSKIIYLYSGQGQIAKLNDSIEKLFRYKDISSINFANDYYNNRFFVSIMFYKDTTVIENNEQIIERKYYPVTLSFNILQNIKSFISLHDFYYNYAFNTKTKCYFLNSDNTDILTINDKYNCLYPMLELYVDKTYPQLKEPKIINVHKTDKENSETKELTLSRYNSIIDVIVNDNFEIIKTLNAVNWSGGNIDYEFKELETSDISNLRMAEDLLDTISCKFIRIYTDTCMTPLINCMQRSNDKSVYDLDNYKYPRYNQGLWTLNYFRNILNSKNNINKYSGDNNSLIEGKYFVIRFVFNSDFKLETLILNYNSKNG